MTRYDYIIVGAGTAGCVIASRLAEDPAVRVLLLEAGPPDNHWSIRIPSAIGRNYKSGPYNWGFWSTPQKHLNDRVIVQAGGILPTELLRSIGIEVETKFGTA